MPNDRSLPRWEVSSLFPGLDSREFTAARERLGAGLTRLTALYDLHEVRAGSPHLPTADEVAAFDEVLEATNAVADDSRLLTAYLYAFVTTDAGDDPAASALSQVQAELAGSQRLRKRLEGWLATLGVEHLVAASPLAADHAYPLRRAAQAADHQMSEAEEGLFADLNLTGGSAWNRLHGDVTAGLTACMAWPDGEAEDIPVTVARALATHPDPAVRRAAYDAELATWRQAAVPLAAALNAIKGEASTVNRRRGWSDPLEPALWANAVDRRTLAAMQEAAVASFGDFRRYLRAKASLLGDSDGLAWWDMLAPVGSAAGRDVSWPEAVGAVEDVFAGYSQPLAGLARRAVDDRWIDAEPRAGKRGGAFCMPVREDESRVLLNFDGSWDSVQTLAHELGHAYHNTALSHRTSLQRQLPMALAETASIFCETLMMTEGLRRAKGADRLALLDTDLSGACQVIVDIHSRFLFETHVFERRVNGTLGVAELCGLMTDAQAATYGDGLDPATYHPFMWAVKPHYYSSAFYNWPYTFGLLFGIGLHARYEADPVRFRASYDDLLGSAGLADAADLAAGFGIDVRAPEFWRESIGVIQGRIDEYVDLSADVRAGAPR
ncbi:MAG: M3 family oligoendopeptidase [Acidimicrobiales bacterium]